MIKKWSFWLLVVTLVIVIVYPFIFLFVELYPFSLFCLADSLKNDLLTYYGSAISAISTILLGCITICIQHKYQEEIRKEREIQHKYQNEIVEDRRLSFQPYFYSHKNEIDVSKFDKCTDNENLIVLCDYYPKNIVDDSNTSKTINALQSNKKYCFFAYCIKNVGRDSAININLSFNGKSVYKFTKLKSEEENFHICIDPNKDKAVKIKLSYESLDGKNYIQEETIVFDNSFKDDDIKPGWEMVDSSYLSAPRQYQNEISEELKQKLV